MAQHKPNLDQMTTERSEIWGSFMGVTKWTVILIALALVIMAVTLV